MKEKRQDVISKASVSTRLRRDRGLIDSHTHLGAGMARSGVPYSLCFPWFCSDYFQLAAYRKGRFRRDPHRSSSSPYEVETLHLCREIYEAFPEYAGTPVEETALRRTGPRTLDGSALRAGDGSGRAAQTPRASPATDRARQHHAFSLRREHNNETE
ncbi:MAG: hypothetical protein HQ559_08830 [Lentisphaerae bacterium]|nr:hypothetical protein [Lentisphaerota bacterium]